MGLLLEAVDVAGSLRWRWLLRDEETGNPLADHSVNLDPAADEVTRFRDLYEYVRSSAAPDRRTEDGIRFVRAAGAWAGRELLGESVGAAIVAQAPVTVHVKVPAALDAVLLWPLELAHAAGKPLAVHGDVTLVYDIAADAAARRKSGVGASLRMLAVFSQPTQTSVLALRRERYALSQLIRRIAGRERAMVTLAIVQYGVTRERLRQIADSEDGWDVLHMSGHGAGGIFVLENADGSPDLVPAGDLVELLRPVRQRVKLAVVSACQSAADTAAQTLRLIGLTDQAEAVEAESGEQGATHMHGLARALVRELDCAVVAMRYPVTDEFAIAFGDEFYEHLFTRRQPVDVAMARALARVAGPAPSAARPAISLATPGVFGTRAAGLTLAAPRGTPVIDLAGQRMAYFPSEPARFVGRAAAMARASAALAPGSGRTAVLLHGMAGAGKTACALELAYRHADAFAAAAFWQAPTREQEWPSALPSLANALDIQLGDYGFTMASHIGSVAALEKFLPRLRRVLADSGVLLVLDNLETLLTPDGTWRDPRWSQLAAALTEHEGESRVIATSRITPAGLGSAVVSLPIHALSLDEAAALARELPNLRDLLHADGGPVRAVADLNADRDRVLRVLRVVQGHPKLLELADAAAADRDRLDTQLAAAEDAAAGQLEAFFQNGVTNLDADQFFAALSGWTTTALGALPDEARLMAEFVACLEDDDRQLVVIEGNWSDLWRRLARPGDPPEPEPLLATLATAALVEAETLASEDGTSREALRRYRMHPGVAAAVHAVASQGVRDATDIEIAAYWGGISSWAAEREGGEHSGVVVHASLAVVPYLLRLREWDAASSFLNRAAARDQSPATVQAVLAPMRQIADVTDDSRAQAALAHTLALAGSAEAEGLLRDAIRQAVGDDDYSAASARTSHLVSLLRRSGRLTEALDAVGQMTAYTRQAGLGPWTQLSDEGQRLQILAHMGHHQQVLTEVGTLRVRMNQLPERRDETEGAQPWNVREATLDVGHTSAVALGEWRQCLELNAEILASMRRRDAGIYQVACIRFNDVGPLIRLGRLAEAGQLLSDCQQAFGDHGDISGVAVALNARAELEYQLRHRAAAVDHARTAIRFNYVNPEPKSVALGHHNLAIYMRKASPDATAQRAHRLAAALIYQLTGMAYELAETLQVLAIELRESDDDDRLPGSVTDVVRVAEQTEGVRLGALITALEPNAQKVENALAEILRTAAELPPEDEDAIARSLQEWEPIIAAIAATCLAQQDAPAELTQALDGLADRPDWAALAAVLRRVLAGERGDSLLDGLDDIDTAIARETLTRLTRAG